MNWTGGRLQRHSKSNSKKTLKTQRDHFAKARLQSQQGFDIKKPLHFSACNTRNYSALPHRRQLSGKDPETQIELETRGGQQTVRQGIQAFYPSSSSIQVPAAGDDLETLPPDNWLLTAASSRDSAVPLVRNDFDSARQALLSRFDWSKLSATKPPRMSFSPRTEMQRIGRHRRIHAQSEMHPKTLPKDENQPFQMAVLEQEGIRNESENEHSSRPGSGSHQTENPYNRTSMRLSEPAQPDSTDFTVSSQCEERLPCVEDNKLWRDRGMVARNVAYWQDATETQGFESSQINRPVYLDRIDQQSHLRVYRASQTSSLELSSKNVSSGGFYRGCNGLDQKVSVAASIDAFERSSIHSLTDEQRSPWIRNSECTERFPHVSNAASGDDEESGIRAAFATDFDQIQKDFEFLPTPSRRTANLSTMSRFRKIKLGNYGDIEPSQAMSRGFVQHISRNEAANYSIEPVLDDTAYSQLYRNSHHDEGLELNSDALSYVNNTDDVLDNHALSITTYNKPTSFAHLTSGLGISTPELWSRSGMDAGTPAIGVECLKRGRPPSSPDRKLTRPSAPFSYHSTSRAALQAFDTPYSPRKRRHVSLHDRRGLSLDKRWGIQQQALTQSFPASESSYLSVVRQDEHNSGSLVKFPATAYPPKTVVRSTSLLARVLNDEGLGYFQSKRFVTRKADLVSDLRSSPPFFSRPCTQYFGEL